MNLGLRLAAWRKHAGLSQSKLAQILGITRSAVWQWERGETVPRTQYLTTAVDAIGITMEQFYGSTPPKTRKVGKRAAA